MSSSTGSILPSGKLAGSREGFSAFNFAQCGHGVGDRQTRTIARMLRFSFSAATVQANQLSCKALRVSWQGKAIYLPGSRPSYFDAENLNLTPFTRKRLKQNLLSWDSLPDTRWKSNAGTSRNRERQYTISPLLRCNTRLTRRMKIERDGRDSGAVFRLQAGISPLDRVNATQAREPTNNGRNRQG